MRSLTAWGAEHPVVRGAGTCRVERGGRLYQWLLAALQSGSHAAHAFAE